LSGFGGSGGSAKPEAAALDLAVGYQQVGAHPLWLAAQRAFDVLVGQLFSAAMRGQLSGVANALVSNDPSGSAGIQAG
jgi:hypothetical protein